MLMIVMYSHSSSSIKDRSTRLICAVADSISHLNVVMTVQLLINLHSGSILDFGGPIASMLAIAQITCTVIARHLYVMNAFGFHGVNFAILSHLTGS